MTAYVGNAYRKVYIGNRLRTIQTAPLHFDRDGTL